MKNVHYINAGAGAGKTYTLVTILKNILTDKNHPCSPSEIILTTYTKAAAKEFREKTFTRLLEAPAALDVAKILDTATIGTVHSVAQQYIQRYWSLLEYSGQFNVMSDTDKERYINRSLKNAAKHDDLVFFHEYTKDFNVTYYDSEKGRTLTDYDFWKRYVLEIVSKMRAYNIAASKLGQFAKQSCDVVDRLFVHDFDLEKFKSIAKDYVDFLVDNITNGKGATKNASKDKKAVYDIFIASKTFSDAVLKDFSKSKFYKYATYIDLASNDSGEKSKQYIQNCLVLNSANGARVKDCIRRIFEIAGNWDKRFEDYKRTNNLLDFDDLEAKFLKLLDMSAVQDDIRSSVKYLFVDEFQDSNPIQLKIFKRLSDLVQVKSYWVGDRKQAIYGFRGSDSSLTTSLLKLFPAPVPKQTSGFVPNADGCTSQLIDTSYRSIKSLVELANEVFEKSFTAGVPSEQINNVPLQAKRKDGIIEKPIQHWHCDSEDALADRVVEILNGNVTTIPGVYDGNGPDEKDDDNNKDWRTTIVPSDIAVLSRTKVECGKIADALRKKGIPVSSPETSITDKAEVKLVMALLKYVAGINRRYAKTELTKLIEDKEIGDILADIANKRFDYNPSFDEADYEKDPTDSKDCSETDASKSKTKSKDPDALFADLNDKLQGLRGLNISALVKGVIAVMDVRNIVAKWGNAEIRQDNLDTLIEQSIAYEQSTAHSSDCATVSGFIRYMEDLKIQPELDQSTEGVKVATYHKSKGLQWKIVILNSLDSDELELTDFVKKNWFGLNLRGGFGTAELQLIPNCGEVKNTMAEIVEDLSKKGVGNDDNGYYKMLHGKVEGEIKRLLYVGATRACDYLITLSMPTTKPLAWMKNVIGTPTRPAPAALDSPDNQINGTDVDLWGVAAHPAYYEQLHEGFHTYSFGSKTALKLPPASVDGTTDHKTISPSSSQARYAAAAQLINNFNSQSINHKTIKDYAAFGTCIHNFMAAHRWDGKCNIETNKPTNLALAAQTVKNHGMDSVLTQPEQLAQAADTLFTYLENNYGKGELLRECPFTYCRDNSQLVSGEIDLIWKTEKDCILIDHKNFPANPSYGRNIVLSDNSDNKFYIGKYFSQLGDYRAALSAAGMNVTHAFVFYAVLGCLVEVTFK